MLNWIKKFFANNNIKKLQEENFELKQKLNEKQEHINKTNAYWKKKMHYLNTKK